MQYGNNGVCCVKDIVMGMAGIDMGTEYYIMVPIGNKTNYIYLPTNNEKAKIRPVISAEQANDALSQIDSINEYTIVNEKQCELVYKDAIFSLDCIRWLELLKTLCIRKQTRALNGKKTTSTDERYFKIVSTKLFEEFGVAIGESEAEKKLNEAIEIFEGCVSL